MDGGSIPPETLTRWHQGDAVETHPWEVVSERRSIGAVEVDQCHRRLAGRGRRRVDLELIDPLAVASRASLVALRGGGQPKDSEPDERIASTAA